MNGTNAEGTEISQIRDFMVEFRLNDEGDLQLAEFGESCRDAILEKAYPRLLEAMTTGPMTHMAALQPKAKRWSAKQSRRKERGRSKPTGLPQPATEAARTLQKKMGASAAYANRAVEKMATNVREGS